MNNLIKILWIITGIVFLGSCATQEINLKKLDLIPATRYYSNDIFYDSNQHIYGVWKLTSTSGGLSGSGFDKDFDYLLLKPNAIFGVVRNDSLIGYGKLTLLSDSPVFYNNSIHCNFDFDQTAGIQLNNDPEKYISLTNNDTLNLTAPCCDRYNLQLVRQNSDLNSVNQGTLKGKISIGPLCPVETIPPRPECQPTAETYKAWQISVWNQSKTRVIVDIMPALDGNYSIQLPAGNYIVDFKTPKTYTAGGNNLPKQVTISKGINTTLDITIDTGIR